MKFNTTNCCTFYLTMKNCLTKQYQKSASQLLINYSTIMVHRWMPIHAQSLIYKTATTFQKKITAFLQQSSNNISTQRLATSFEDFIIGRRPRNTRSTNILGSREGPIFLKILALIIQSIVKPYRWTLYKNGKVSKQAAIQNLNTSHQTNA